MKGNFLIKIIKLRLTAFIIPALRSMDYLSIAIIMLRNKQPQLSVLSVQFSHSVVSDSLWPHEPQHTRPPYPTSTTRVYPNSCPLSQWCNTTVSSSVVPFSSCLQSFPTWGFFQMSQLFTSAGQNIGVSASVSPTNEHPEPISSRMEWLISLHFKGLSRVFSNTTV